MIKRMKIRKLQLKNIGVFDDETIEFKECPAKDKAEIHILTGENGSGKTTILQALVSIFNNYLSRDPLRRNPTGLIWGNDINSFSKKFHHISDEDGIYVQSYVKCERLPLNPFKYEFSETVVFADPQTGEIIVDDQRDFSEDNYKKINTPINSYRKSVQNYNGEIVGFGVFAFSGYRQIESETVQANYLPKEFNPLSQSLEFVKDYRKEGEITINQLVANNISNRALSKEDGSLEESKRYETVINSIETFIKDVTDYEVKFVLKRSPNELKIRMHGEELEFDVLPDGLRSLISWIADLLGRVDLLKWQDDLPITEKNLILFLDEIEVHLHPAWQRKVLPLVQKLFKNAQIFVSTHSPFVVNSVDDAWVYKLKVNDGKAKVESVTKSEDGNSYSYVLEEIFDIKEEFGIEAEKELDEFYELRNSILSNGSSEKDIKKITKLAKDIAKQSEELNTIVQIEIRQINRKKGLDLKV